MLVSTPSIYQTSLLSPSNQTPTLVESSEEIRALRYFNPLINYDYKCGHYLGIWDQLYPSLINSFIEVTRGVRKAP